MFKVADYPGYPDHIEKNSQNFDFYSKVDINMFKVADYPGYPGHIEKHLSKFWLLLQSWYQHV